MGRPVVKYIAIAVCVLIILVIGFAFLAQNMALKSLSAAAKLPYIQDFALSFFTSFNQKNFQYIYDEMFRPEFKNSLGYADFNQRIEEVYAKMGPAKNIRLFSYNFKTNSSPQEGKARTLLFLNYYSEHEQGGSISQFILAKSDDAWLIANINMLTQVTAQSKKRLEKIEKIDIP